MKTPPSNSDPQWENLLNRAKADLAPPVDLAALLHAVRQAPAASRANWAEEFRALFATSRFIPGCFAAAAAFALVASWQAWESLQDVPWVQLIDSTIGGAS